MKFFSFLIFFYLIILFCETRKSIFFSVFNLIKDYLKWLNAISITGKEFGLNGPFISPNNDFNF